MSALQDRITEEEPLVLGKRVPKPIFSSQRMLRFALYVLAIALSVWIIIPLFLITVASFSTRNAVYNYPKDFFPNPISFETMDFFINSQGVYAAMLNSLIVGAITLVLSLVIGAPAGYALARFIFPGRETYKLIILTTRAFPIVILSIPLAVTFIGWGLYDSVWAVAIVHTALALPQTVLITSSIFISVPNELEEAAMTLGCHRMQAFTRIVLPMALPGLAAAAIFAFVLSWNEVFAAVILSVQNRTLPAHILAALNNSSLPVRYAAGFILIVPSLIFILIIRRYLLNMWGRVVK
jgi:multiple sugar transport system permease protein